MNTKLASLISIFAITLFLAACSPDGPAEKFGETVDETVDKINPSGPAEKAGEMIDDTAEEIKEEARQAKEKIEDAANH